MTYDTLAAADSIARTVAALKERNIDALVVQSKEEALKKIKEYLPQGASLMNGSSRTLEEIGFIEYLKSGQHGWKNLHEEILRETNPEKQAQLRRESVLADFYLGSVHALAETGESIIVSNTGSQLPHIVYTSPNLIFVVGTQKITPTLEQAQARVREYVVPLEDARALEAYKSHTRLSKEFVYHFENPHLGRKVRMILVEEKLGF